MIHARDRRRGFRKYHGGSETDKALQIFVVDKYDYRAQPFPIEESTEIFKRYEDIRQIDRIYVAPEDFERGEKILNGEAAFRKRRSFILMGSATCATHFVDFLILRTMTRAGVLKFCATTGE